MLSRADLESALNVVTLLDAFLPLTALGKPVPAFLSVHYHSFLLFELSVSPLDLADELSDCKLIEQDNSPDSLGTHSSIVLCRCWVITGTPSESIRVSIDFSQ